MFHCSMVRTVHVHGHVRVQRGGNWSERILYPSNEQ